MTRKFARTSSRRFLACACAVAGLALAVIAQPVDAQQDLQPRAAPAKKSLQQLQALPSTSRVVVKFREGSGMRLRSGAISSPSANSAPFNQALQAYDIRPGSIARMHSRPEAALDAERAEGQRRSGKALADLNLYYFIEVPPGRSAASFANYLNSLDIVEFAEPAPVPMPPPVDIAPTTPNYTGQQGYKSAAPTGIGATTVAGIAGANGLNVKIVDVEYSWQLNHEDLEIPGGNVVAPGCTPQDPFNDTNHGTAVLGEMVGESNGYGVTGIVPAATAFVAPANCSNLGYNPAAAINAASAAISPGDVIVIEQQYPVCGFSGSNGYGPLEGGLQDVFDAIQLATANGRIVVAAAGNGSVNLDSSSNPNNCNNKFNRSVRDSGAIIVGAGDYTGTHEPLYFSSYGSRVDVQGWGDGVTTTGYGYLFDGGGDVRQRYTAAFNGTSSATPIVAGAVAAVQGIRKACGLPVATPAQMRAALSSTGTPQGTGGTYGGRHIGPLPDIRSAVAATPGGAACVPPANDDFAGAIAIQPGQTLAGSNVNATKQANEPVLPFSVGGVSVWWKFTPAVTGTYRLVTAGSNFDTMLGVFRGAALGSLTLVARNDDAPSTKTSQVVFSATAGTTYWIMVDGFASATGNISLFLSNPLPTIAISASNVTPDFGSSGGGTWVTINGSGFNNFIEVTFGGIPAGGYQGTSNTQITALTPAHAPGPINIRVVTPTAVHVGSKVFTFVGSKTALSAVPTRVKRGQAPTVVATVQASPAGPTPTGNVSLKDGSTTIDTRALVNGKATFKPAGLSVGERRLTAVYAGTTAIGGSTSAEVVVSVSPMLGAEQAANTRTIGSQSSPAIAALPTGHVIAWVSNGQDGSGQGVFAQRFGGAGAKAGAEFRVNTATAGNQFRPTVAALKNGGFIAAWTSQQQEAGTGIYAQRYAKAGSKAGAELHVNTTTASDQSYPTVAALASGGFLIAWASKGQDSSGFGIYAQRFSAAGVKAGPEFRVSTAKAGDQYLPSATGLKSGGFVVAWQSPAQDGSGFGIFAKRYKGNGVPVPVIGSSTGEFRVNTTTANDQQMPSVAATSDGGFVVAWQSAGQDGNGVGIYAQRFNSAGQKLGGEFRVNTTTASHQTEPSVAAFGDRGFVIAWTSLLQDGSGKGVFAQLFKANGARVNREFRINTWTAGDQWQPRIAAMASGRFVAAWTSKGQDGSLEGVYFNRFQSAIPP